MSIINGEELVARTIRLLKENGIEDIAISSENPVFEKFNVPVLKHDNLYNCKWHTIEKGDWFNCFYPTDEPVCYIFGDVFFSDKAIKIIVETETNDIEFFGSKPPFANNYIKDHEEPFALKVVNTKHLKKAIQKTKQLEKQNKFWRKPIMWELWTVIKDVPLQVKAEEYPADYIVINDYTCDIDWKEDIIKIEKMLIGGEKMIRVEVIADFTLAKFDEIKDSIVRKSVEQDGRLFTGDIFECTKEMADYLLGENALKRAFVKVIEVVPEKEIQKAINKAVKEEVKVEKPKRTRTSKKTIEKED